MQLNLLRNFGLPGMGYLKRSWDWYWTLSFPLKLVISIAVSSLGGGSYVALIAEFGSYFYAIENGFRPPFEGIPYLRASVILLATAVSIMLAIYGLFVVAVIDILRRIINFGLRYKIIKKLFAKYKYYDGLLKFTRWVIHYIVPVYLAATMILVIYFSIDISFSFSIEIFLSNIVLMIILIAHTIQARSYFATAVFGILIALLPLFLFRPHFYAGFLRFFNYGGGMPIEMTVSSDDRVRGSLLLRTDKAVFVDVLDKSGLQLTLTEIPMTEVTSIVYRIN